MFKDHLVGNLLRTRLGYSDTSLYSRVAMCLAWYYENIHPAKKLVDVSGNLVVTTHHAFELLRTGEDTVIRNHRFEIAEALGVQSLPSLRNVADTSQARTSLVHKIADVYQRVIEGGFNESEFTNAFFAEDNTLLFRWLEAIRTLGIDKIYDYEDDDEGMPNRILIRTSVDEHNFHKVTITCHDSGLGSCEATEYPSVTFCLRCYAQRPTDHEVRWAILDCTVDLVGAITILERLVKQLS